MSLYTKEWLSLLEEGKTLAITPIGTSMFPMFATPKDQAILVSINNKRLHRGDVVLYRRHSGMLVLHRIVKKTGNNFYMTGDNQTKIEGPIHISQIKAIMIAFRRKNHLISCQNPIYILLSYIWLFFRPIRPVISRPLGILYLFLYKKLQK